MSTGDIALSLPSLGAWIETRLPFVSVTSTLGRSLHWERGLKPALAR